jgi:hypothetical protein
MRRERIKVAAFYLLCIAVAVNFVALPLANTVKKKKEILNTSIETYKTRTRLADRLERDSRAKEARSVQEKDSLLSSAYLGKTAPYMAIQIEILEAITQSAEKNGLTVANFEFPEVPVAKDLSEVPVLVRLKGSPKALIGVLKDMEQSKKALLFKRFETGKSGQEYTFTLSVAALRIET